jgi:hypothetical protein
MKKSFYIICFFTFFSGIFLNFLFFLLTFKFRFFAGPIFEFYLNFIDNFLPKHGIQIDYIITNIENLNLFEEALGFSFFCLTLIISCLFFIFFFLRHLFHFKIFYIILSYFFLFFLGYFFFGFKHFFFFYEETPSQCLVTDMELTLNLVIDLSKYFVILLFFITPLFFIPFFFFLRYFILLIYFFKEKEIFNFYNNEPLLQNITNNNKNILFKEKILFFENENTFLELTSENKINYVIFTKSLFIELLFTFFFFNYLSCFIYIFFKTIILRKKWDLNPR